ncbi:MAG: response regulator [Candidatus Pristimantibacillus lignocellulolyticus]|uniref:Response regulator n=1 Tax=Candidatus Pristimantibacillus lignocellulolyticus TaxID=2994561 RepID=A0A9J6ZG83_9BACL|nr:MAG: response regulator [Candidatus Pristimantibacillus lignocellulolyticus]
MNILVVDDEHTIRDGVARTIQTVNPNWNIHTAESGEAALKYLDIIDFHIVIMDIMMPGMSGLDLLQEGSSLNKNIRWIVISAHSDFQYAQQAIRYGARDYILKPIGKPKLLELLQKLETEINEENLAKQYNLSLHNLLLQAKEMAFKEWISSKNPHHEYFNLDVFRIQFEPCIAVLVHILNPPLTTANVKTLTVHITEQLNEYGEAWTVHLEKQTFITLFTSDYLKQTKNIDENLYLKIEQQIQVLGKCDIHITNVIESFYHLPERINQMLDMKSIPHSKESYLSSEEVITTAIQYIEDHYQDNLSLEKVAAIVYLHPVYFSQLFKKITGKGYKDFVIQLRLEQAKKLLITSQLKVVEVAEQVGYSDLRHFTQIFRKVVQLTPSEYRSKNRIIHC